MWKPLARSVVLAGLMVLPPAALPAHGASDRSNVALIVPFDEGGPLAWKRIEVPDLGEETLERARLRFGPETYPERTYQLQAPADEPFFEDQWHLRNTRQLGGTSGADVNALGAWDDTLGDGVVVAVVDSGIHSGHPDFAGRMWVNVGEVPGDGLDNDGNGYPDDVDGWNFVSGNNNPVPPTTSGGDTHGTAVAGVVAAAVNGNGVTGLAPGARLMNLRACGFDGCGSWEVAWAIVYAVDNGADVVNLSLGAPAPNNGPEWDAITYDAYTYALEHGVIIATAAGNLHPSQIQVGWTIIPAAFPHANNISVAATTPADTLTDWSFFDSTTDIAAPGESILTTHPSGWAYMDGTSFSAPLVASAAALVLADTPGATYREVIARLEGFARRLPDLDGKVRTGRLDAGMAVSHRFVDAVGHLFEGDIEWLASAGITKGCNPPANSRFCPDENVTRGQMAAFLGRTFGYPVSVTNWFVDDNGHLFESEINALADSGVTRGCNPPSNNHFCPDRFVNRGQMAAFLVRALRLPSATSDWFEDDEGHLFESEINALAEAGVTRGCNPPANDRFCPDQRVTRGQMAAFLHRIGDAD